LSAEYLGAPRFRVTEIEGYPVGKGGGNSALRTSFAIVDRAYCCAKVWSDYVYDDRRGGNSPLWLRRAKAHARCDELNVKHA